ncbi:MAG TPA: hypothetical protein DCE48_09290 [Lachnospiraceae bacterium]|uniref:hypothetical protein n=1 Tax=Anaerosporobacter sp. TaxID=1872529 RepID=UPI000EDB2EF1|nr:hypothetical protein [Anaerosporobacter sp.]HAB60882.1 hypothetical protein [Lachnospiraceae bacterium]
MSSTEKLFMIIILALWTMSFIQYNILSKNKCEHEQEILEQLVKEFNSGNGTEEKCKRVRKFVVDKGRGRYR